jgi:hypothetical protein
VPVWHLRFILSWAGLTIVRWGALKTTGVLNVRKKKRGVKIPVKRGELDNENNKQA